MPQPVRFNVEIDANFDVIGNGFSEVRNTPLPDQWRNALLERLLSHRIDCSRVNDLATLAKMQGRIAELEELLSLNSD